MKDKTIYHINNIYFDNPLKFDDIRLIQIGRRFCEPSAIIPAHPHLNWFELTIATSGSGIVSTNNQPHKINTGEIYLSFPCDIHEIRATENEKFEYDFFSFYCDNGEWNTALEEIIKNYRSPAKRTFRDNKISALIGYALTEFSTDKIYFKEVASGIFHLILAYLIRDFSNITQETATISDAKIICLQLMNYIDTHIYSVQNLESVAEQYNYNYNYLSALFKKTTGKKLSEYYQNRRLETARTLLNAKKKIGEVSEMLNYSSPFAFSKAFKRSFGVSPKQYQTRISAAGELLSKR